MSIRDESGHTIDQAEDAIQAAMRASDIAELDLLIADDLVFAGPDGTLIGKAADLEAHRTGATRFARIWILHRTLAPIPARAVFFSCAAALGRV